QETDKNALPDTDVPAVADSSDPSSDNGDVAEASNTGNSQDDPAPASTALVADTSTDEDRHVTSDASRDIASAKDKSEDSEDEQTDLNEIVASILDSKRI